MEEHAERMYRVIAGGLNVKSMELADELVVEADEGDEVDNGSAHDEF